MGDHEHAVIKHSDHLLLDQSLLRLPSELLRKNFRSAHFAIEKDTAALKTILKESATAAVSGRADQEDVLKNIDAMIARMRGVKRKLTAYAEDEARLHSQAAARISHLNELYSMDTVEDVKYEAWSRKRLDRLVADYLLRKGYNDTARELAVQKGMQDLVDIDTFASMNRIQDALRNGSVTEALAWCADNKKELRKMESKLEFMLRFQQYIELVRSQSPAKLNEAITHAKKYLIPYRQTFPDEVQQACGLLAFPPNNPAATYAEVYKPNRWDDLAMLFTTTHNRLLALPSIPLLHVAMSAGLSALKTPACHSSTSHQNKDASATTLGNGVCPICSTELHELARNVPYAHHTKSHVEHDLVLLPNDCVYGKQQVELLAKKSGLGPGLVKDLRTGEILDATLMKRVYIT